MFHPSRAQPKSVVWNMPKELFIVDVKLHCTGINIVIIVLPSWSSLFKRSVNVLYFRISIVQHSHQQSVKILVLLSSDWDCPHCHWDRKSVHVVIGTGKGYRTGRSKKSSLLIEIYLGWCQESAIQYSIVQLNGDRFNMEWRMQNFYEEFLVGAILIEYEAKNTRRM